MIPLPKRMKWYVQRWKMHIIKGIQILRENKEILGRAADYLLEKETITGKEFVGILKEY